MESQSVKIEAKMLHRKYCVLTAVLIYIILVTLFFNLRSEPRTRIFLDCDKEKQCVSFCCKNGTICDQKYIDKNFDADELLSNHLSTKFQAIFNKPECNLKEVKSKSKWNILQNGEIQVKDAFHLTDSYCFENDESNEEVEWKLFICTSDESLFVALHFVCKFKSFDL